MPPGKPRSAPKTREEKEEMLKPWQKKFLSKAGKYIRILLARRLKGTGSWGKDDFDHGRKRKQSTWEKANNQVTRADINIIINTKGFSVTYKLSRHIPGGDEDVPNTPLSKQEARFNFDTRGEFLGISDRDAGDKNEATKQTLVSEFYKDYLSFLRDLEKRTSIKRQREKAQSK